MSVDKLKRPPLERMEPETPPLDDLEHGSQISIAISLKRIADVLERLEQMVGEEKVFSKPKERK